MIKIYKVQGGDLPPIYYQEMRTAKLIAEYFESQSDIEYTIEIIEVPDHNEAMEQMNRK